MRLPQDLRYAFRRFLKEPGFTAVVVATLALGIGSNTAIFTLTNAVLFRGLPFPDSERAMALNSRNLKQAKSRTGVSYPDFLDLQARSKTFRALAAFSFETMNLSDAERLPEQYKGNAVTPNMFRTLGQHPYLGRDFPLDDQTNRQQPVAIISYGLWQNRYGGATEIIGKTVTVNEVPRTVIGVMPKGMTFLNEADVWVPVVPDEDTLRRDNRRFQVIGFLADRYSLNDARAEMSTAAAALRHSYPATNKDMGFLVQPYAERVNGGEIRIVFLALQGAVCFVLLIVCANVANLLLSRTVARSKEMAVRTALGASRWRLMSQMLTESVMLGILGGVLGLLLARWGIRAFDLAVSNTGKPPWIVFDMDLTVLAYFAAVSIGTGVLFGFVPAWRVAARDVNDSLKEGGRTGGTHSRSGFFSSAMVVTQVALSVILLAGAGLMIRSFLKVYNLNANLPASQVLTMGLRPPEAKYKDDAALVDFFDRLTPGMASLAGVRSFAFAGSLPGMGASNEKYETEGKPAEEREKAPSVYAVAVGGAYFDTLDIPILRGHALTERDYLAKEHAVVINQRFASQLWPREDPIGKRVRFLDGKIGWMQIVGVCGNVRQVSVTDPEPDPVVYVPYRAAPERSVSLMLRTGTDPAGLSRAAREEIRKLDPNLPAYEVQTLSEAEALRRWPFRVFGSMFAIFAGIALFLSALGLYSVISYSVSQRTNEIGIRIALGATGGNILSIVMRRGLWHLAIGLGLGLAAALGLTRAISVILVQTSPTDPATFAAITAILAAAGLIACWTPARRAARVDPIDALRHE